VRTMLTILTILALSVSAVGGPLQRREIAADAKWVVHIDLEAAVGSEFGKLVMEELSGGEHVAKLAAFEAAFGFHPLRDVKSITMYGQSFVPGKGAVLIRGDFDFPLLVTLLRKNDTYEELKYGDYVLHRWIDKRPHKKRSNKPVVGCFRQDGVGVIAGEKELVEQALDVLDGKRENLAAGRSFVATHSTASFQGMFFFAAAQGFHDLPKTENPKAALLKQADGLRLILGEKEGKIYAKLLLAVKTPEIATQIHQVLQGMIAWGMLVGDRRPELAKLAQSAALDVTDTTVQLGVSYPAKELFEKIKAKHQEKRSKDEALED